ncbi:DNA/RNA non-specific endonuclease [Minicystis rosea]|nr:DNA/RNA non-specific endonuclease [Minicystis rosea]
MSTGIEDENRAAQVADFLRGLFAGPQFELFQDNRDDEKQRYLESSGQSEELVSRAVDGLHEALDGQALSHDRLEALEAIVLKDQCPTLEIADDTFVPPKGRWESLGQHQAWLTDVIRAAGRVDCASLREPYVGSGLLVAPNLVMTNRHVARVFANGFGLKENLERRFPSEFDFRHEKSTPLARDPVTVVDVLLIHPHWDIAVLQVAPPAADQHAPVQLSGVPPQKLEEHEIAVIGYPFFSFVGSEYDTRVLLDNFGDTPGVKRLQPGRLTERLSYFDPTDRWPKVLAVGHNASTLGGNSGSLVVSLAERRILAVHFAGQAFKTNWAVPTWELARDARIRDLGITFHGDGADLTPDPEVEKAWAALAPRPATIAVPTPPPSPEVTARAPDPVADVVVRAAPKAASDLAAPSLPDASSFIIPLEITVRPLVIEARPRISAASPPTERVAAALERIAVDPDYASRDGYDPDHLDVTIPMPALTDAAMALVSRDRTQEDDDNHILHYHHFSLVMNKRRRLAFFTACNTTRDPALFGKKSRSTLSNGDTWVPDPRIPVQHQITTAELYGPSPFDRGHIVRREDAYWGMTDREREWGNFDTFHYTNCSPQHPDYNQSQKHGVWGELENQIAGEAKAKDLRLSYFAGPVLAPRDPVLWGVRVPRQFWKVVLCVDDRTHALSAFAFLLSQADLVAGVKEESTFDAGALKPHLVSIARLEQLTDVRFPEVVKLADVRRSKSPAESVVLLPGRPIST